MRCPICDTYAEFMGFESDGEEITEYYECLRCGHTFTEVYLEEDEDE